MAYRQGENTPMNHERYRAGQVCRIYTFRVGTYNLHFALEFYTDQSYVR